MKKNLLLAGLMILGVSAIAQTPRLSLYEEFTGETCPPCASTNPGLNALLSSPTNTPKIIAIKWQVPIPSAPSNTWSLYQTNKVEIDWRWRSLASGGYGYTPAINSAPSSKIDGREATVFGASSGHPANLNNNVISAAQSQTAAFSVTMNRAWDATGTAINLTVNIQATAPFTAVGPLVFRTVMVERLITFSVQPGTNGEKVFEDAAIKSFPTLQNGVSMASTWTIGQTQTFTLSCAIPSYVRKRSEIAFVGFIQDDGNQRVAQAVRADKQPVPDDAQAVAANVDIACTSTIAPKVTIKNNGLNAITSMTISPFVDGTAAAPFMWTGNIASGASTVITLSSITAPTAAGAHTFSYNITAMNAVDIDPTNNKAKVSFVVASNYQGTPVAEGFEGAFPPTGFTAINPDGGTAGWSKSTASGTGAYNLSSFSTKYNFYGNTVIGDQDELVLPPISLLGTATPELDFDIAYVQRVATNNDKLEVFASDNCGATWTSIWSQAGANMTTMNPVTYAYVPGANITDWRTEQILLNNFNSASVLVKFVTTSDNGNNLYLDNINLFQSAPTGVAKNKSATFQALVFPNPANNNDTVLINAPVS
ncbi:MAG: hypothetical protein IT236_15505, partial [Bacteroidia bacterium]|nr:hypothetical protein [Bacteroidia bacterium]